MDHRMNALGSGRNVWNDAKMGYYRTDDLTTQSLLRFLEPPSKETLSFNLLDPCCGEGIALADISMHLSSAGAKVVTYGIEIDAKRAATARKELTHVRHASHDQVRMNTNSISLLFLNPPYGDTLSSDNSKSERLTHIFYGANNHYLHPHGILALLIPFRDLTPGFCQGLARYKNVQVFRAAVDTYKQVLFLAQNMPKRGSNEINKDVYKTLVAIGKGEVQPPPINTVEPELTYTIPSATQTMFDALVLSLDDAHHLGMNHPQKSKLMRSMFRPETPIPSPLTRVQDGHIATALIPSGVINGEIQSPDGLVNIQGTTFRETVKRIEIKEFLDSVSTFEHSKDITQSEIIVWKKDGPRLDITRVTRAAKEKTVNIDAKGEVTNQDVVYQHAHHSVTGVDHYNDTPPTTPVEVLKTARVEGNVLYLRDELPRDLYEKTNKIIQTIGGKWNRKAKGHVFDSSPWDAISDYITTGNVRNDKKDFQFFPTPAIVARQVAQMADIQPGMLVLEPSAGTGRIADAIRIEGVEPVCCELWEKNRAILAEKGYEIIADDFLTLTDLDIWPDRILLNPPYAKSADAKHTLHAYDMLKPGGRLVAILPLSWTFRNDGPYPRLRELATSSYAQWEELPENAFVESGTRIRTGILVLDKPE